MEAAKVFLIFTQRLEKANINYMATGSVASMIYGIPRFTHDLDLVLDLVSQQVQSICAAFPIDDFYAPPEDVIRVELNRPQRGHFNLIHHETGLKADIYLHGRDALQTWGLIHKQRIVLSDEAGIWVAPPEYVIIRKLEYYREGCSEKHLDDIIGMFQISSDMIDLEIIQEWAARLDLQKQWQKISEARP